MIRSLALAALASASLAFAAPTTFDFKDPKGVNAIQFSLDSVLEPIAGTASGISGSVSFDAADVAATRGAIVVEAKSLKVPNSNMTGHLVSPGWIDAPGHPEIRFEFAKLDDVKPAGDRRWSAVANGKFTLRGVTRDVSIPVTLNFLPGQAGQRINKPEQGGDLLVVRGAFEIARADYGIKPGQNEDKVAPIVQLSFAVVGTSK